MDGVRSLVEKMWGNFTIFTCYENLWVTFNELTILPPVQYNNDKRTNWTNKNNQANKILVLYRHFDHHILIIRPNFHSC